MVVAFNATFNNISVLTWRSVLFVEGTGENHTHLVVIVTDCIGSHKSNYHTITTATTHHEIAMASSNIILYCQSIENGKIELRKFSILMF